MERNEQLIKGHIRPKKSPSPKRKYYRVVSERKKFSRGQVKITPIKNNDTALKTYSVKIAYIFRREWNIFLLCLCTMVTLIMVTSVGTWFEHTENSWEYWEPSIFLFSTETCQHVRASVTQCSDVIKIVWQESRETRVPSESSVLASFRSRNTWNMYRSMDNHDSPPVAAEGILKYVEFVVYRCHKSSVPSTLSTSAREVSHAVWQDISFALHP